ncbi:putative O-glycosylation ligase, exosortase A system-associated [Sulfurirhabdus autotrophica]|uniref:Putative O-glycosylation ligase (Exosortase A-associated) n=1 Tax=Sulfurirhabdus autotrophica TaxID=1706046 RepID=A0A4R3Y8V9_9PROT|nr:putative O-glycosylation ligase, exosortase A system-associated [Sulfurirhabdus autotrophica]TCV88112.1 putative O-glycosylation ligase (exosortase A-associated) [Sulfurirhabdus autotrophica]
MTEMRDFAIFTMLLSFAMLAMYRPWLGVLGLAILSYMHPQGYALGFAKHIPVFLILFGVVSLSTVTHYVRTRPSYTLPFDWRLVFLIALWLWFGVSSYFAIFPSGALEKYIDVLKILPPLLLTLLLIDGREKLRYLMITIVVAILIVAVKGGYWAVINGFHDRVYGPPGSPYADNNEFAVVVSMVIPLLFLWLRESKDKLLRMVIMGGILLCYGSVISSWSRGGMLALFVVTLMLLWHSKKKLLAVPFLVIVLAGFFVQLPGNWFERMETLSAVEQDASAQSRLAVWRIGREFVLHHPVTGGGFDAWPALTLSTGGPLDWHSAYVEMATEHGLVGLAIWSLLLFGTLASLTRLGVTAARKGLTWAADYAAMIRASLMAYMVGGLTLGIAYWELPYHLIMIAIVLGEIVTKGIFDKNETGIDQNSSKSG